MSGSGGKGGPSLPGWIQALRTFAIRIQGYGGGVRGVTLAIVSFVLPLLVTMLFIRPLEYAIAFIELAGTIIADVVGTVEAKVAMAFEPVSAAILGSSSSTGVVDMVYGSVEAGLMDAGLGAPFAATLTVVVFATVLTVLLYVLLRVGADLVPGVGGLIR